MKNMIKTEKLVLAMVMVMLLVPGAYGGASSVAIAIAGASDGGSAISTSEAIATDGNSAEAMTIAISTGNTVESKCTATNDACQSVNGATSGDSTSGGSEGSNTGTGGTTAVIGGSTTTNTVTGNTAIGGTNTISSTNIGGIPIDIRPSNGQGTGIYSYSYSATSNDRSDSRQITARDNNGDIITVSGNSNVLVPVQEKTGNVYNGDAVKINKIDQGQSRSQSEQYRTPLSWLLGLLHIT